MAFDGFDEQAGSPQVRLVASGTSTATRTGKVLWSSLDALIAELLPGSGLVAPSLPGFPGLLVQSVNIEPFVGDKTPVTDLGPTSTPSTNLSVSLMNRYDHALVTIEYSSLQDTSEGGGGGQGLDPVVNLSHRWTMNDDSFEVEGLGLEWSVGGAADGEPERPIYATIPLPIITHQMTWSRVEVPPFAAIRDCIGGVNSTEMSFKTGSIAPETLRFAGVELNRDVLSTGALAWELTYIFEERRVELAAADGALTVGGWNHFYRDEIDKDSGKTGFYRLRVKTGQPNAGNPVFALKALGNLFIQGA